MRRLSGVAVAIVSLVVSLAIAEVALRALGHSSLGINPQPARFWRHDSLLGWHHRAGASGVFDHRPEFLIHIRINDKGLRGRDYSYERLPGKRRILALGDSFVFGYGVEQAEIFTEILEGLLPTTEVINAGVSGYGTDQELLWFRSEGVRYRPDLVILLMTGNDDLENHSSLVYWVYPKPRFVLSERGELQLTNVPVPPSPRRLRLKTWALSHSATAYQTYLAVGRIRAPAGTRAQDRDGLTLALVDELRREVQGVGARLLVATTSKFWSYNDRPAHEAYSELVTRLRERGIATLDIDRADGYAVEPMSIKGDGHWNALGHRFVARLTQRMIQDEWLFAAQ